eukprot:TRINITY_DN12431_c1_g1_i1.p1 TRINITY_DN12431_c1_g1~~TRINITY_DN12431_c1_g1_i1.p1  ORF type:complete len:281 (+),score=45.77 TRINITY_DN12431_c1_g1_i1:117-845(+)
MPGYRLYRSVVAGATGRVGDALTRQLLLSPLCSEVHSVARREARAFDGLAAAAAKLRHHAGDFGAERCGLEASALQGVDAAFCVLGARCWSSESEVAEVERDAALNFARLCAEAGVPHISLLSSAWADPKSSLLPFGRIQGETVEALSAMEGFKRISIFRPAAATGPDGSLLPSDSPSLLGRGMWRSLPLAAQFMPNRYRPVALDDIALALRLNVELCHSSQRVELLDYRDMMMIIGKDVAI